MRFKMVLHCFSIETFNFDPVCEVLLSFITESMPLNPAFVLLASLRHSNMRLWHGTFLRPSSSKPKCTVDAVVHSSGGLSAAKHNPPCNGLTWQLSYMPLTKTPDKRPWIDSKTKNIKKYVQNYSWTIAANVGQIVRVSILVCLTSWVSPSKPCQWSAAAPWPCLANGLA